MGFFTSVKARKASMLINKGDNEGAMKLYEEAVKEGIIDEVGGMKDALYKLHEMIDVYKGKL